MIIKEPFYWMALFYLSILHLTYIVSVIISFAEPFSTKSV